MEPSSSSPSPPPRPRVLAVDLGTVPTEGARVAAVEEFRDSDPRRDRIGARGGASLACALLVRGMSASTAAGGRPASTAGEGLVISVGEGVSRGVPTAVRATLSARSPVTGRLGEGQVGGELGAQLARVTDALHLHGRAPQAERGWVLAIEAGPRVSLRPLGLPVDASPREILDRLQREHGSEAALCVGTAGLRRHPDALLVAGGTPSHSVGRGGLGAVFAGLGLRALVLEPGVGSEGPDELRGGGEDARGILEALSNSPRLRARAEGGSFELYTEREARGLEVVGRALAQEAEGQRAGRHGCKGCPTPCGWTFAGGPEGDSTEGGSTVGARFSATHALGTRLGPVDFAASRRLLARCDRWGLDAKGVALHLEHLWMRSSSVERGRARAFPEGHVERLLGWIDAYVEAGGETATEVRPRALGGSSEPGLATELAIAVSTRGEDPMRAFTFAAEGGLDRGRLVELLAPRSLPPGAEDPSEPAGKGVLVAWHEELSAALDTSGFCSFSAAGLLADGVLDPDALAELLAPRSLRTSREFTRNPGRAWLATGRELIELQRTFAVDDPGLEPVGEPGSPLRRAWLEYRRAVDGGSMPGHDERDGAPRGGIRDRAEEVGAPREASGAAGDGRVRLRCHGELARHLSAESSRELADSRTLGELLERLEGEIPSLRGRLLGSSGPIPSIYRAGRRLGMADRIHGGETLDLVLAIRGG